MHMQTEKTMSECKCEDCQCSATICPRCGEKAVEYAAYDDSLVCTSCGYDLVKDPDQLIGFS